MNKKSSLFIYNKTVFAGVSFLFLLGLFILFYLTLYKLEYYRLLLFLSTFFLGLLAVLKAVEIGKKPIIFSWNKQELVIQEGNETQALSWSEIKNYNAFYFPLRQFGYILRLSTSDKKYYYFLASQKLFQWTEEEQKEVNDLMIQIRNKVEKKISSEDYFLRFVLSILYPLTMLGLTIWFLFSYF